MNGSQFVALQYIFDELPSALNLPRDMINDMHWLIAMGYVRLEVIHGPTGDYVKTAITKKGNATLRRERFKGIPS